MIRKEVIQLIAEGDEHSRWYSNDFQNQVQRARMPTTFIRYDSKV